MDDNWVIQALEYAFARWNGTLAEIWEIVTMTPQEFRGGEIWGIIETINGALQSVAYALLVLFFVVGVMKSCGTFTEMKRPEAAVKGFVRFALAKGAVSYGMELMLALLEIVQGIVSKIMSASMFGTPESGILPETISEAIGECSLIASIPLWIVTILTCAAVWILSFVLILTVYGRFFRLYMYTAIAPIPLSAFGGEPTSFIGTGFLKSYAGVCLEGAIIVLSCVIFSVFACGTPTVDPEASAAVMVWSYMGELIFNMLILVGCVRMSDKLVHEMLSL